MSVFKGKCDKCSKPLMHDGVEYICGYCDNVPHTIHTAAICTINDTKCPDCGRELDPVEIGPQMHVGCGWNTPKGKEYEATADRAIKKAIKEAKEKGYKIL